MDFRLVRTICKHITNIKPSLLLLSILMVAVFFRLAKFYDFFFLDHDHDLILWIVKDIFIEHHLRLVGNLTRIEGLFIGPFYYYMMVPFVALFKMNPIAIITPTLLISIATVLSIYYVFSKFFGRATGLIGAFIYAVSMQISFFDRVPYPTQPVYLWSTWFIYTLFALLKGEKKALIVGGILTGLIWHIHIVLLPLLPLAFLSIWLSGKKPVFKNFILPSVVIFALTLPFWIFEFRHGFIQIKSILALLSLTMSESGSLIIRLSKTLEAQASAFVKPFAYQLKVSPLLGYIAFVVVSAFLRRINALSNKQIILIWSWVLLSLISQFLSGRKLSDYYFDNLVIISILLVSIFLSKRKILAAVVLPVLFTFSLTTFINKPAFGNAYVQKKLLVERIKRDMHESNYPCAGVTYIATPGSGVGFRYLFWLNGLHIINPSEQVPTYNILIPTRSYPDEMIFGGIGLRLPSIKNFTNQEICNNPDNQLPQLLGFTD